jgi:hypothetical protein
MCMDRTKAVTLQCTFIKLKRSVCIPDSDEESVLFASQTRIRMKKAFRL